MADIELVIKIPENIYQVIKKGYTMLGGRSSKTISSILIAAVVNGVPLPKGHGRLIDADAVLVEPFGDTHRDINSAETIIEADVSEVKE